MVRTVFYGIFVTSNWDLAADTSNQDKTVYSKKISLTHNPFNFLRFVSKARRIILAD